MQKITDAANEQTYVAIALQLRGRVAYHRGDLVQATELLTKALAITESTCVPKAAWRVHATMAHLMIQSGDDERANLHCQKCRQIVDDLANSFGRTIPLGEKMKARIEEVIGQILGSIEPTTR